ncbi:hypothetical protein G7Y79_00054g088980 [Physcia stellaris]|nr:hypothetical protein G7Y79_00054g088980 [Physcia stellaris]
MAIRSWISTVSVSVSNFIICLKNRKAKTQTESEHEIPTNPPQELDSRVYESQPPQLPPPPPLPPRPTPQAFRELLQGLADYQLETHREIGEAPSPTTLSRRQERHPNWTFVRRRPCDFNDLPGTMNNFSFGTNTSDSPSTADINPPVRYSPAHTNLPVRYSPPSVSPGATTAIDPTTSERVTIRRPRSEPVRGPRPPLNSSLEMLKARVEASRRPRHQLSPTVEALRARVEASRRKHLARTPRGGEWDRGEMQEVHFGVAVRRREGVGDLRAKMVEGEEFGVVRVLGHF